MAGERSLSHEPVDVLFVTSDQLTVDTFLSPVIDCLASESVSSVIAYNRTDASEGGSVSCEVLEVPLMRRNLSPAKVVRSFMRIYHFCRERSVQTLSLHTPLASLIGLVAGFVAGVPRRVWTVHGLLSTGSGGVRAYLYRCVERLCGALATHCHFVSPSLGQYGLERGICGQSKMHLIGAGSFIGLGDDFSIEAEVLSEWAESKRAVLGIPASAFLVGFVGRWSHDKGANDLVHAWATFSESHDDAWLVIVGVDESAGDTPSLLELSRRCNRIRVVKWVQDVRPIMAACDVVVLPSHREGFGMVAIEASALGTPVVGTRIVGLCDAIVDGVTGLAVPPEAPQAIKWALEQLYGDLSLRMRLGAAGKKRAEAEFSRSEILPAYRDLLVGARG
jgi:glycosyltransferase involved in cell wall biosynthesis